MKEIRTLHTGPDIPRWKMFSSKKYWFEKGVATKQEADREATINREMGYLVRIQKHAPFRIAFGDKKTLKYTLWLHK